MLDEQDIKKIGEVIEAKVGPIIDVKLKASEDRIIGAIGEMIEENVLPLIANLPDKAYLDEKLGNSEGHIIVREKKMDQKANLTIEFLRQKQVFGEQEMQQLKTIQVFPSPPAVV